MTEAQIAAFLAVARAGSFNRAAEWLYLAQPTVTHRIRQLEGELGVELFVRGGFGGNTRLSGAGEVFLGHAQELETIAAKMREELRPFRGEDIITIGFSEFMLNGGSAAYFQIMQDIAKQMSVTLRPVPMGPSSTQKDRLLDGEMDILFSDLSAPVWQGDVFSRATLFEGTRYLCLHRDHPWAALPALPVEELPREQLYRYDKESFFGEQLRTYLEGKGTPVHEKLCASAAEALSNLLPEGGVMLTYLRRSVAPHLTYIPLLCDLAMPIGLVWVKRRYTPAMRQLIAAIRALPQEIWRK